MKVHQAKDFPALKSQGIDAYLWYETGTGALGKIDYIRSDYWIHTGGSFGSSWCCCADTAIFTFDNEVERRRFETAMRDNLAARRKAWDEHPKEYWAGTYKVPSVQEVWASFAS